MVWWQHELARYQLGEELVQIVDFPTRGINMLEIVATNQHHLVNKCTRKCINNLEDCELHHNKLTYKSKDRHTTIKFYIKCNSYKRLVTLALGLFM